MERFERALTAAISDGRLAVPPYPATARQLADLLWSTDYSFRAFVRVVSGDPAVSAACARLAGSASATSLEATVFRLGAAAVTRIALAVGLGEAMRRPGPLADVRALLLRRSALAAAICQRLARGHGLCPDEAFVAGLLHDSYAMAIVDTAEQLLERERPEHTPTLADWLDLVSSHRASACAELGEAWSLPGVCARLALPHHGGPCEEAGCGMAELVALASRIIRHLEEHPVPALTLFLDPKMSDEQLDELVCGSAAAIALDVETFTEARPSSARASLVPSLVLPSPSAIHHEIVPVDVEAAYKGRGEERPFRLVGLARDGLVLEGASGLEPNALRRLELRPRDGAPFDLWVTVTRSVEDSGLFRLEARPFAVAGELLTKWIGLLASARVAGAARAAA